MSARLDPAAVDRVVRSLAGATHQQTESNWLRAVATHVTRLRPDLAPELLEVLQPPEPASLPPEDVLAGLSVGQIGVCYEALLADADRASRKGRGQFFTPDDAARFIAQQAMGFPKGVWLDPACGVGNLAWHLTQLQPDPDEFARDRLVLSDRDPVALKTAVALIAAANAEAGATVRALARNSAARDFLDKAPLPPHDFAIANPPYARAAARPDYRTGNSRDLFAYFMERIAASSAGFVVVTPASYLSSLKFQPVRDILSETCAGGRVYVFDNVPDTFFRGHKFGSANTSTTNFVRAAVTVCDPAADSWQVTPILRWQSKTRAQLFQDAPRFLSDRRLGPAGQWAKVAPAYLDLWDALAKHPSETTRTVADLLADAPTEFHLDVASTPRYFVSAAFRHLNRGSKHTLYFPSAGQRDLAAVILNSSLAYFWWRALDGGVTLTRTVLTTTPVPGHLVDEGGVPTPAVRALARRLEQAEGTSLVSKLNAGKSNQNVKHPPGLVRAADQVVMPVQGFDSELLYTNNMFPLVPTGAVAPSG